MTIHILILIALLTLLTMVALVRLVALVTSDGLGHRPDWELPRSHQRDPFEMRSG